MKTCNLLPVIVSLFLISVPVRIFAQEMPDTTSIWQIETLDDKSFTGKIIEEDQSSILLLTDLYGQIRIPVAQIKTRELVDQSKLVKGEVWFENPHSTRYFFGPNGYGLRKGEAYYQNTWVLFNQLNYGIADFFSMGVGVMPLFLFAGAPTPVWITPKVSIPLVRDKVNLGAGALLAYLIGEDVGFGIGYGALTLGNRDKNLTVGAGWAFAEGGWADAPTFVLSGMARVSKKTYLMTEDYFIGIGGEFIALLSLGGRSVQKRLAVDYGLFLPVGTIVDTFIAIPWLGIAVPFGNTPN